MNKLANIVEPTDAASPSRLQLAAVIVGVVALGVGTADLAWGQRLIFVYGLLAIVARLRSQMSFILALFTLAAVPMLSVINKNELSENYAVYAYFLLLIGVISAILELRRSEMEVDKPKYVMVKVRPKRGFKNSERYVRRENN